MPIHDTRTEAVRALQDELAAPALPLARRADLTALGETLDRALADCRAGRMTAAAFWRLVAEADSAIDDARRAWTQRA